MIIIIVIMIIIITKIINHNNYSNNNNKNNDKSNNNNNEDNDDENRNYINKDAKYNNCNDLIDFATTKTKISTIEIKIMKQVNSLCSQILSYRNKIKDQSKSSSNKK